MKRILLAVNDSPAGVAAARAAITFARECGGEVLAVHVAVDTPGPGRRRGAHAPGTHAGSGPAPGTGTGADADAGERASAALLGYIAQLAHESGVPIETRTLPGSPAQVIIDQAADWGPDVIMLGRSGVRHVGQPFVGSQVLHVVEFADVPVLVVPAA